MTRLAARALVASLALAIAAPPAAQPAPDSAAAVGPMGLPVTVSIGGKVHADGRWFPGDASDLSTDGFLVRRARVEVVIEVADRARLLIEPGFGEGEAELVDGWVEADVGPGLTVRAGRFKTPVGLESLRSSDALWFAERGFPTALSPRRDVGVMAYGAWGAGRLEAQAGFFNGVPDGASEQSDRGDAKDVAARVFLRPLGGALAGLGVGVAGAAGIEDGAARDPALAAYETVGDRTVFDYAEGVVADGRRLRLAPQGTLYVGPLGLLGEYTVAWHRVDGPAGAADLSHRAWQAAAVLLLTGESRGEGTPRPRRSVEDGGPGAVEVAARVHGLRVDPDAAPFAAPAAAVREATAWALALNWYPLPGARLGATLERTLFDGADPGAALPPAETLAVVRLQLSL